MRPPGTEFPGDHGRVMLGRGAFATTHRLGRGLSEASAYLPRPAALDTSPSGSRSRPQLSGASVGQEASARRAWSASLPG